MSQRPAHWGNSLRQPSPNKCQLFRMRFMAACSEHLPDAHAIAHMVECPEDCFQSLWLESILAIRLHRPPPHPWFIEFCMRYVRDDAEGFVPPEWLAKDDA